jgi:hypothetical protein
MDAPPDTDARTLRNRQIPLAVVMVALTTLTLWSLGQAIVAEPTEGSTGRSGQAIVTATRG